jgi:hypothetical protein
VPLRPPGDPLFGTETKCDNFKFPLEEGKRNKEAREGEKSFCSWELPLLTAASSSKGTFSIRNSLFPGVVRELFAYTQLSGCCRGHSGRGEGEILSPLMRGKEAFYVCSYVHGRRSVSSVLKLSLGKNIRRRSLSANTWFFQAT